MDSIQFVSGIVAAVAFVGGLASLWSSLPAFRTWFRLGVVPIPLMLAWRELRNINTIGDVYRNVPYFYLWLWVVFWLLLAVVVFLVCVAPAGFRVQISTNFGPWIRSGGPLAFWGHENHRFWCWLAITLFSTIMFVGQSISDHDLSVPAAVPPGFGTVMGWLLWLWEGSSVPMAGPITPASAPTLPPYPIEWWWGGLMIVSWVITPISFVCVFRGEVVDWLKKFAEWLRLRKGEASAAAGVSDASARESRAGAAVAPIVHARDETIGYWIKHIIANALPDLTFGKLFHRKP